VPDREGKCFPALAGAQRVQVVNPERANQGVGYPSASRFFLIVSIIATTLSQSPPLSECFFLMSSYALSLLLMIFVDLIHRNQV